MQSKMLRLPLFRSVYNIYTKWKVKCSFIFGGGRGKGHGAEAGAEMGWARVGHGCSEVEKVEKVGYSSVLAHHEVETIEKAGYMEVCSTLPS